MFRWTRLSGQTRFDVWFTWTLNIMPSVILKSQRFIDISGRRWWWWGGLWVLWSWWWCRWKQVFKFDDRLAWLTQRSTSSLITLKLPRREISRSDQPTSRCFSPDKGLRKATTPPSTSTSSSWCCFDYRNCLDFRNYLDCCSLTTTVPSTYSWTSPTPSTYWWTTSTSPCTTCSRWEVVIGFYSLGIID